MDNIRINADGKYICTKHKLDLQWSQNRSTGEYFLKCPDNKKFECGTREVSEYDALKYDMFAPNRDDAMVDFVKGLMDEDDD
ncbi:MULTISPECIES: hypothetical protein [unclassified Lacrimispora]|uniref:hypothetical protein n=1 Tax=unclassified Lacrimispora TaxID=2719232 RepID=UPI00376F7A95